MHIQWDVNLGTLIGWVITIGGIVFAAGRIANAIQVVGEDVQELKGDFRTHKDEDARRFDAVQATLLEIVMKGNAQK